MGPGKEGHKYLFVLVDTSTGWTEGFASQTESALIIAKKNSFMRYCLNMVCQPRWGPTKAQLS